MLTTKSVNLDGFEHGYSLAACNWYYAKTYEKRMENCEDFDPDDVEKLRDEIVQLCWGADENYRQYSPFEFFAHALNEEENSDELWDAYEEGISDGVNAFIDEKLTELGV